ncbi:type II secretion system minor pseudopilin GspI [Xanthomonas citri pv. glycines]|uniref:Type II secretion system protein I n=1 Tax=Xanthomonas campestris pv. glycines TaxID=473421 RepID=A0AAX0HVE7_XANCG|nr:MULTISPECIES: type II secretion system minor pseudopilin GspI [Xanthomonas]AOY64373.1 type II secretion system protein GspI [Xanthomonas citri pv. glycines str. 8ra]ARV21756.1 type II secretion system protein GspI [Xanthomonas citri pv. glycines str. 12-2]EWC51092.1 general secretion pathway protein I [Xanthomonas citri pv. glycines str. 8ra]OEY88445.1 type II secretion system protein GspI [Xanthomonas citri pv. glycines]OOX02753.1 type II secretion system protein GspI [Xanthomonas citri pv
MRPLANARASGGFSLLELMVALAIFGMAVVGLLNLSGESARTAVVLEERALAAVVAENQAIEATLAPASAIRAPANGRVMLGGRSWEWQRQSLPAGAAGLLRIEVRVRAAGQMQEVASLSMLRSAE